MTPQTTDCRQADARARLLEAAQSGDVSVVRELIEDADADLEAVDQEGATALMLAVQHRQTEVAQALINAGANVDAVDANGQTALMRASGLVSDLFGPVTNRSVNRSDLVRLLIAANAQLELAGVDGKTALMFAAGSHDPEPLRVLIQANANVEATDKHGNTPLLAACRCRAVENVRMLLEARARVDVMNITGETPLIAATSTEYFLGNLRITLVRLLIDANADVQGTNSLGQTVLHLASMYGQVEMVNDLLKGGANIDARCFKGDTALIYAVEGGSHGDVIDALLQAGADPTIVNQEGKTAMDLLAANGNQRCAEAIQRAIDHQHADVADKVGSSDPEEPTRFREAMASSRCSSHEGFDVLSNADTVSTDFTSAFGFDSREDDHRDLASSLMRVGQVLAEENGAIEVSRQTIGKSIEAPTTASNRPQVDAASRDHPETKPAHHDAVVERSDDNSKIVIAVLDPGDQSGCPFHYAVLACEGDAKRFEDLADGVTSDPNAATAVRLVTRSKSVETLCAAEYAHSIGYHEVGDYLATKMDNAASISLNTSNAVSVTLLENSTDFSFVYGAEKSKGSVDRCSLLLDDDEGDDDDKIDRRIQAEVVRDVDTRFMSWSPLELACQLGYLQVVNSLLKRNVKTVERKPVVRARALERAEALRCA